MALEDWFHCESQCCGGVHSSASAGGLNGQRDPTASLLSFVIALYLTLLICFETNMHQPLGGIFPLDARTHS